MSKNEEEKLWEEYFKTRDTKIRNKIAIFYYNLIEYLVNKNYKGKEVKEDLVNVGMLSLLDAIEKFQPNMNNKFITYAYYKVNGAIIDYLRKINKSIDNKNLEKLNSVIIELKNSGIDNPNYEQIAQKLNLSIEEFFEFVDKIEMKKVNSIFELIDMEKNNEKIEIKAILKYIIEKKLNELEKKVLSLYYYEDFTFKEIGEILDLTEARISQIHSIAILKIKINLKYNQLLTNVFLK